MRTLLILIITLGTTLVACAQEAIDHSLPVRGYEPASQFLPVRGNESASHSQPVRTRVGLSVGYGFQNGLGVSYHHNVLFLEAQWARSLRHSDRWLIEALVLPQLNLTRYRPVDGQDPLVGGHEFGLNLGIRAGRHVLDGRILVYAGGAVGPHYVSGVPQRQVAGFLFSDNLFTGLNLSLGSRSALDLRANFRHISNASLRQPNGGINNLVVFVGWLYAL